MSVREERYVDRFQWVREKGSVASAVVVVDVFT